MNKLNIYERKVKLLPFIFSMAISSLSFHVFALEDDKPLEETYSDDTSLVEIAGLIMDRTMTRLGRDFYVAFSLIMNNDYGDLEVNLLVSERPTALSGSIITVNHFDKILFRAALSPGRDQAEQKAQQAMHAVRSYVIKWKTEKQFKDTFDVERSEL